MEQKRDYDGHVIQKFCTRFDVYELCDGIDSWHFYSSRLYLSVLRHLFDFLWMFVRATRRRIGSSFSVERWWHVFSSLDNSRKKETIVVWAELRRPDRAQSECWTADTIRNTSQQTP